MKMPYEHETWLYQDSSQFFKTTTYYILSVFKILYYIPSIIQHETYT